MEPQTQKPQTPPPAASGGGLAPNVASLLCYLCGWVTGLVFLLIEKQNKEVKFHAWQSILLGIAVTAIYILLIVLGAIGLGRITGILTLVVWLGMIVVSIVCMVKAYQGSRFKLPYLGDIAEQQANK